MTISYKPGDVLYAPLEYVGGAGRKTRPVLVVLDTGDLDVLVARITSRPARDAYDVQVANIESAGLPRTSTLRLSKMTTIPRAEIIKQLGALSTSDRRAVWAVLRRLTDSWT